MVKKRNKKNKPVAKDDVFVKQHDLVKQIRNNQGMPLDDRKVRKKRKRKIRKKRIVIMFMLICLFISLGYYMYSPYSNIKYIYVNGNEIVSNNTIKSVARINEGSKIYLIFERNTRNRIIGLPFIESAELKRDFKNQSVYIEVEETKVVAYTEDNKIFDYKGDWAYVDEELLASVANVPMIIGIQDELMLKKLSIALGELDEIVWNMISEIIYANDEFDDEMLNILLVNNKRVVITIDDITKKLGFLPTLNEEQPNQCVWYFSYGQNVIGESCE